MADEENEVQAVDEMSDGGLTRKLIFGGIGVFLLAGGIFAGFAIKNMNSPPASEEAARPMAEAGWRQVEKIMGS